jgi:ureidoglycolate hydrolase
MLPKVVLLFCLVLSIHSQSFTGLNLDPNLVAATNNAMSNLKGLLTIYSCSGNQYLTFHLDSSRTPMAGVVSTRSDTCCTQ